MKFILLTFTLLVSLSISLAFIDYSHREKRSISKDGLSSWELYVMNDLFFQITMKKCPKISRPVASSLKDYITEAVKLAPRNEAQHELFLETYTKLMDCFDHLDKGSKNPGKKLPSVQFINNDASKEPQTREEINENSEEKWFVQPNNVESLPPTVGPTSEDDGDVWHWQWMNKILHLFSKIFRVKRAILSEDEDSEESNRKILKKQVNNEDVRHILDSKNKFINLLHEMNRVVQVSCPVEMKPEGKFSRKVLLEIVEWLSEDSHSLVATSTKYFSKDESFIKQVHECLQSL